MIGGGLNASTARFYAAIASILDLGEHFHARIVNFALPVGTAHKHSRANVFTPFEALAPSAPAEHTLLPDADL